MPRIHIRNWPRPVEAGRSRILDAALDAGVPYPHGCRSGECGGCRSRLLEGRVARERCSPDALDDAQVRDGLFLACRARAEGDVTVEWLADADAAEHAAVVRSVERVAHDVVLLTVARADDLPYVFRPGQFARLRFGRLPPRSYSMATQPGSPQVAFHVRVLPEGLVSGHVARQLRAGDRLTLHGPFGDASWRPGTRTPRLVLAAGGTGLAPVLSVLDAALADGHDPRAIHVYHGVRTPQDLYAGDALRRRASETGLRFEPVFSEDGPGRRGFVHEALAADFDELRDAVVHAAGPPPMVDAVRGVALARGAPADRILADGFHAAEPARDGLWARIASWARRAA